MRVNYLKIFVAILTVFTLVSCGSKRKAATKRNPKEVIEKPIKGEVTKETDEKVTVITKPRSADKVANYIEDFKDAAIKEMQLYKIPASITLAQGILESGSGAGRLAVEANNHFGIKCHTGWTGGRIYHDDDEDQECFRKYKDPDYSYRDHSLFLTQRKRYAGLFELAQNDYKGWARGLRKAGYATDKKYPQKLISLIERYDLDQYDDVALGNPVDEPDPIPVPAGATRHTVRAGDTLYSLGKLYGISVDDLKKKNNLRSNDLSIGQVLIVK